ncbi:MAG: cytochrome P450 [Flavobacteriaceae bacterium]|nr:cytochrome P450 [Flavobacteriaceae bacterium]
MPTYKYPNSISFFRFLFNSSEITKNPIPFQRKWFEEKGDSFSVWSPLRGHIILTRDAKISKQILQKKHKIYHKSKLQTKFLSKYVGYGLLTSSGDYWLQQRRLIQPGFHKEKIQNLVSITQASIDEEVGKIETGQFTDLYPIMNTLAFEVVAKSLFDFSASKDTMRRLQSIIEQLQRFIVKEIRQPHKKLKYWLSGEIRYHMKLVKESREIVLSIIEQRRRSHQRHDDLLDMLLNARYEDGTSMTNDQLIDEILILFVAGHETTANALTFTLSLLAQHQEVLAKAAAETAEISEKKFSNLETIANLNYIRSCIEESMRLYPPAWITDRVATEDDFLGDYHIKKGTLLGISIYELHRSKQYWQNPEVFDPGRFYGNKKIDTSYYLPFGAGPRLCIGNNFAMFEMILAINTILKKFEIQSDNKPIEFLPLITLKPVGIKLKFSSIS